METKVIRVNPKEIKLVEVNARFMTADGFQRLVENIKRDGCLTQLPFCVYNDNWELQVLSGNHRIQAAIEAGLEEIDVQVTEDTLSKDERVAIQLSHNAISGQDDVEILKYLYESIDDVNMKEYSGLDDEVLKIINDANKSIEDENKSDSSDPEYQVLSIMFLPSEIDDIERTFKDIMKETRRNKAIMARMSEYDTYLETIADVSEGSRIKNTAAGFMAMLEIVKNHIEELKSVWIEDAKDREYVPISTIIGRSNIRAKDGRILDKAIELMISNGEITNKENAMAALAKKYLESKGELKKERKRSK